ncbi:MAG: twin-arginine translocation signal domain-containing protein, partial [Bacteroidales bacterium]|nr:twin-arginine translocation signal domain-containing protein [Bacteroidales bacterium]
MKNKLKRRDFMRTTAAATGGLAFSQLAMASTYMNEERTLRI